MIAVTGARTTVTPWHSIVLHDVDEHAAEQIVRAAAGGQFISKDDFRARSGVGQTICDLLDKLGILGKLPESNQLSLFDLM